MGLFRRNKNNNKPLLRQIIDLVPPWILTSCTNTYKMRDVDEFIRRLYLCLQNFEKSFDEIIEKTPSSWNIPEDYILSLKKTLFSKEWLSETKSQFLAFNKYSLKIK